MSNQVVIQSKDPLFNEKRGYEVCRYFVGYQEFVEVHLDDSVDGETNYRFYPDEVIPE